MRTHCKYGHPKAGKQCPTCKEADRRRRKDRLFHDGLTPLERQTQARKKWAWPPNFLRRPEPRETA